ncbi:MAG: hypothetical protein HY680_08530 [Chloroflexi bacterium]|nr:hypothetical protein [Chloroflexota bacterium]
MSKLLDRLDRIARGPGRTLGFAPPSARETVPTMSLLAQVNAGSPAEAESLLTAGADAIILPGPADPKAPLELPEGSLWGMEVPGLDKAQADAYREMGCDFLVFGIADTRVDALEEGECTRILRVAANLEETLLRCVEDLPVDVVIVSKPGPEGPLSLAHLLAIANVRSATSRYVLLEWDADLSPKELEHLRDMGVDGIVVKYSGNTSSGTISALRERIAGLPPRKPKSDREGRAPILPRLEGGLAPARQRQPEPDEEEEEDY